MDRSECTSRLLASAMHELRNALAVIRESVGLASDVARIQARGDDAAGNISKEMKDRTVEGLEDVQRQVSRGGEQRTAVRPFPRDSRLQRPRQAARQKLPYGIRIRVQ